MKRFLITTALEDTWCADQPVLFLGEWCRRFSRRESWAALDAEVLPYHWDDRAKLEADYHYLQDFYERLLLDLTVQLNQIHGVDQSPRAWRILIGPWLGYFIQMLFDRWTSLHEASRRYELSGTVVLTGQEDTLVPNDMADFERLYVEDEWNHRLCADILHRTATVPCVERPRRLPVGPNAVPAVIGWKRRIKQTLTDWSVRASSMWTRDRDAFLLHTYLPLGDELKLYRRLGQLPQLWRSVPPVQVAVDGRQRRWPVAGESRSEFEACARAMIPQQIPTVYLEGYRQLRGQTAGLPWPKRPKLIWTSNAFCSDDVFKAWAGEKTEQGAPLVIGQHGGHYGVGRWSFTEEHEVAISDGYLSWGWADAEQPKVRPVGQFKAKRPLGVRHAQQSEALLVTAVVPRYSYWMHSVMVSRQWLDYFDDQCAFIRSLPVPIRQAVTVRLYPADLGWDQARRWRDQFPDLRLDDGQGDIRHLIRRSRLYISTYNATTFLESFAMNVPTVIFWNPNHWELRDSAIPCFDDLMRVGIFHETPESAARHVGSIWNDVEPWWMSPDVRAALDRFTRRYCDLPPDLLGRIEQSLRDLIAHSPSHPSFRGVHPGI